MKQRSRRNDYLVYLVIRLVVCVLQALPSGMGFRVARGLAWLAYRIDKRHRQVAHDNLCHAFPELADNFAARDRLVRDCYRHFCTMLIEILYLPRKLHLENWSHYIALADPKFIEAIVTGRPVMVLTAHFGNWEAAGYLMGLLGAKSYAIARTLDNPYLDRFFKKFREKTGQTILAKKDDFDNITTALADSGILATLADQDAGARGLFVPFFHRPASTHKAVALLALEYRALMVVTGIPRIRQPMRFSVETEEVIDAIHYADRPDAVTAITERFTQAIERIVRRHPEQYFWLHRRWKHQPPVRKTKAKPESTG